MTSNTTNPQREYIVANYDEDSGVAYDATGRGIFATSPAGAAMRYAKTHLFPYAPAVDVTCIGGSIDRPLFALYAEQSQGAGVDGEGWASVMVRDKFAA